MPTAAASQSSTKRIPALRGVCEKSARDLVSIISRSSRKSPAALTDMVDSLTGVIERTTELLLAGKGVRIVEDDQALTTQEAADLLNVSRPHLVKLLETGEIPQLPKVGRHRRVARFEVFGYKREREAKRALALGELAALSQTHRLG